MNSTPDSTATAPVSLTQDWAGHTMDMAGALLLVVAAVFLFSLLLKHFQSKTAAGGNHLKIIQALSVGTKDRVLLVQVGVDQILMGISAAGIVHLHTLTEPVDITETKLTPKDGTPPNFANVIKTIAGKKSL